MEHGYQAMLYDNKFVAQDAQHANFGYMHVLFSYPLVTGSSDVHGMVRVAQKSTSSTYFAVAILCRLPQMIETCVKSPTQLRLFEREIYSEKFISTADASKQRSLMLKPFWIQDMIKENWGDAGNVTKELGRYLCKVMAYKDEDEVARLHSEPAFSKTLDVQLKNGYKIHYNLAPPLLAKCAPKTGEQQKQLHGLWVLAAFKLLIKMKDLRCTVFDPFDKTEERLHERQMMLDTSRKSMRWSPSLKVSTMLQPDSRPVFLMGYEPMVM